MKIKFSILLICLLFACCKRDTSVPTNNKTGNTQPCIDTLKIPPYNDTTYNFPRFNPNDSNEIIYVQGIQSPSSVRLMKKNLVTGLETYIVSGVWGMPDWSIKDWIVFNHADNQVWKIKSNGDSLTLLTTNMQGGFYAIWSPDGNRIAYKNTNTPVATLICDENGNALDSIPWEINYMSQWSKDGKYICGLANNGDYVNIAYQNVFTKVAYKTNNVPNAINSNNIDCYVSWTPDSQNIIWSSWSGLYKTNITTNQTTLLKECCNQRYYISVSVSPNGQKIIAQSMGVAGLCLMDINGKNEVVIK